MKKRGAVKILAIGIIVLFIGSSIVSSIHIDRKKNSIELVEKLFESVRERNTGMLDNMIDYAPYNESFFSDYANRRYFERIIEDEEYEGLRKRYDVFSGRNEEEYMDRYIEQVMERFPYLHDYFFDDYERDDGGYDTKECFNEITQRDAKPGIPVRKNATTRSKGSPGRRKAVLEQRKDLLKGKNTVEYSMRCIVEAIFSGTKRRFGETLFSIQEKHRCIEMWLRTILWNVLIYPR
jgi:hypothetical protein